MLQHISVGCQTSRRDSCQVETPYSLSCDTIGSVTSNTLRGVSYSVLAHHSKVWKVRTCDENMVEPWGISSLTKCCSKIQLLGGYVELEIPHLGLWYSWVNHATPIPGNVLWSSPSGHYLSLSWAVSLLSASRSQPPSIFPSPSATYCSSSCWFPQHRPHG